MAHLVAVVPKAQVEVAMVARVAHSVSAALGEIAELALQRFTVVVVAVVVTTAVVVGTPTDMAGGSPVAVVAPPSQLIRASL
jgi:hypothetical protein